MIIGRDKLFDILDNKYRERCGYTTIYPVKFSEPKHLKDAIESNEDKELYFSEVGRLLYSINERSGIENVSRNFDDLMEYTYEPSEVLEVIDKVYEFDKSVYLTSPEGIIEPDESGSFKWEGNPMDVYASLCVRKVNENAYEILLRISMDFWKTASVSELLAYTSKKSLEDAFNSLYNGLCDWFTSEQFAKELLYIVRG